MNTKTAILFGVQFAIINVAYTQSLNRILPNCGLNMLPIAETLGNQLKYYPYDLPYELLPNMYPGAIQPNALQTLPKLQQFANGLQALPNLQQLPSLTQTLPNLQQLTGVTQALPNAMQILPNVLQGVTPAVIEDNSVASSLANALQILVVSNLLRNTLPQVRDVIDPYPPVEYISSSPYGVGGVKYLY